MADSTDPSPHLDDRARAVFRSLVETYLSSGDPVGSRTLSRNLDENISAATIRNVMQDLEFLGLLGSPHVSAGRVPTQQGLRLFVDGIVEMQGLDDPEKLQLEETLAGSDPDVDSVLERAGTVLSALTQGASLILAPSEQARVKHIEFVTLNPEQALVVLVTTDGQVENRLFTPPPGLTPSSMREAANFMNTILAGRSLAELRRVISKEIATHRQELDLVAARLIEAGVAVWSEATTEQDRLIVRGASHLLQDATNQDDLERIRLLFDDIERKSDLANLLELTEQGSGVRVFIGSENKLFSLTGSSLVVSPYMNSDRKIIGTIGVIGPTRLNYGRIVPIVDYTAQLVGRLVSGQSIKG